MKVSQSSTEIMSAMATRNNLKCKEWFGAFLRSWKTSIGEDKPNDGNQQSNRMQD